MKTWTHVCLSIKTIMNHDKDDNPQSETSRIHQSPKSGLTGHGCSMHLQINIKSRKFKPWYVKDQWLYPIHNQGAKSQWGTSSVLKSSIHDIMDMEFLYTFKFNIESVILEHWRLDLFGTYMDISGSMRIIDMSGIYVNIGDIKDHEN